MDLFFFEPVDFVVHWFLFFLLASLWLFICFLWFSLFFFVFPFYVLILNSCSFAGFWLSLFLFIGFLWCFCSSSLVFTFFSLVFSRFWRHSKFKIKICKTGQHYKFQCVATWNHSIAIQSAYFRAKKCMLSCLNPACFSP